MLLLGMLVGFSIACCAYLVGYGAGHTNGFLSREPEQGDAFASEPLRWPATSGSIVHPLPSTPAPPRDFGPPGTAICQGCDGTGGPSWSCAGCRGAGLFLRELDRTRVATVGLNSTRADALERLS